MLIKTYGEHWRRDWVNWKRGKFLAGNGKNQSRKANFWYMRGIYALYSGFELVYIGQTTKQSLGTRLKQHTHNESSGRWDTFSWYGLQDIVNPKDNYGYLRPGKLNATEREKIENIIEAFESLAIRIADPPLNRKRGKFGKSEEHAERFHQFASESDNEVISDVLRKMQKEGKDQRKKIEKIWNKIK